MKRIAISELEGAALDWAVAKATCPGSFADSCRDDGLPHWSVGWLSKGRPTTDWSQCGPLIERYKVELHFHEEYVADDGVGPVWEAMLSELWLAPADEYDPIGKTPLIAACRAIVASHNPSGYVEVPDELLHPDNNS